MTRFSDSGYVDRFNDLGEYPRIHAEITAALQRVAKGQKVIDLGACTGLLAHRLAAFCPSVYALEPNVSYRSRAAEHPRVRWIERGVTMSALDDLGDFLERERITVVAARRVFPEIGRDVTREFASVARQAGVRTIVLEGRVESVRSTGDLRNADLEVAALSPCFIEEATERARRETVPTQVRVLTVGWSL